MRSFTVFRRCWLRRDLDDHHATSFRLLRTGEI
jgi:hypothetical protein